MDNKEILKNLKFKSENLAFPEFVDEDDDELENDNENVSVDYETAVPEINILATKPKK